MSPEHELYFVYVTTPDLEQAKKLGRYLIEERLAACINITPGMTSLYHWKNKLEEAHEVVLMAKTNGLKRDMLIQAVREHHSSDVPCVLAIPVAAGNPDYMAWLHDSLR